MKALVSRPKTKPVVANH
jgi:hypothetical protein